MRAAAETRLEALLRRDRLVVLSALSAITILAWAHVIYLAAQMEMGGMDMSGFRMAVTATGMLMMPAFQQWSLTEFVLTFLMWVVMMVGMMTPSAAPIILLYARGGRQAAADGKPFASTVWFLSGYMIAWTAFALAATGAQWALDRAALLTATMAAASTVLGGAVLIAAGLYQWTPLKEKCLVQCQSPVTFIQRNGGFRRDALGSLRLGATHGAFCVGCCWALMTLLFVGGVMNMLWISAIAVFVLAEKVIPAGRIIARTAGVIFMVGGLWILLAGTTA
jgi:predicted metal-binding membrane protein